MLIIEDVIYMKKINHNRKSNIIRLPNECNNKDIMNIAIPKDTIMAKTQRDNKNKICAVCNARNYDNNPKCYHCGSNKFQTFTKIDNNI